MPNISKIKILNGDVYNFKDNSAVKSVTESEGVVTVAKQDGTSSSFNVITQHQNISSLAPKNSPSFTGTPTAPTAANGTNSTQIATTAFVMNAFQANDAMVFKGTIGSSGATVTTLPNTHYQGWTYKVITAGTYAGKVCEVGDMIICVTDGTTATDSHWTVVQTNIDGAVTGPSSSTNAHVAAFDGTTGKVIKDSGYTIGKSVPSDAKFTDTTYTFDGTYNASTNKAATVSTITNAINALDGNLNNTTPAAGKTLTAFQQSDGKVSATFGNISITKSQVSDFPTSMTPTSHSHGNIQNGGTLQTDDITVADGDKLVVTDSSNSSKIARTSISFDGTTTNKALTPKGTWESFTNNAGTITGITMNGSSKGTSGVVDLGTVITSHQNISGKADKSATVSNVAYDSTNAKITKTINGTTSDVVTVSTLKTALGSMPASDVSSWAKASSKPSYSYSEITGTVPTSALPSYVDDVLEYTAKSSFPATGETGKIYVDTTTNLTYRWSGTTYVEISPSLALGETSSTAYRGDRGKTAYDHSQVTSGNPHSVTKSDVGLGNVGNFKAVSTVASQGLSNTEKSNARTNIGAGTSSLTLGTSSSTAYRGDYGNTAYTHATDSNRLTTAKSNGLYKIATTSHGHVSSVTAVQKSDITALGIPAQDTTYTAASAAPLMDGTAAVGTSVKYAREDHVHPTDSRIMSHVIVSATQPAAATQFEGDIWIVLDEG